MKTTDRLGLLSELVLAQKRLLISPWRIFGTAPAAPYLPARGRRWAPLPLKSDHQLPIFISDFAVSVPYVRRLKRDDFRLDSLSF
jgi:hypothetical protein